MQHRLFPPARKRSLSRLSVKCMASRSIDSFIYMMMETIQGSIDELKERLNHLRVKVMPGLISNIR